MCTTDTSNVSQDAQTTDQRTCAWIPSQCPEVMEGDCALIALWLNICDTLVPRLVLHYRSDPKLQRLRAWPTWKQRGLGIRTNHSYSIASLARCVCRHDETSWKKCTWLVVLVGVESQLFQCYIRRRTYLMATSCNVCGASWPGGPQSDANHQVSAPRCRTEIAGTGESNRLVGLVARCTIP